MLFKQIPDLLNIVSILPTLTIKAPYSQDVVMYFGEDAGKQRVAMSLSTLIYNKIRGIDSCNDLYKLWRWTEANQLAIYKHGRGFELGATEKQIQVVVRAGLEPATRPQYLRVTMYKAGALNANRIIVNDWRLLCLRKIIYQLKYESYPDNVDHCDLIMRDVSAVCLKTGLLTHSCRRIILHPF